MGTRFEVSPAQLGAYCGKSLVITVFDDVEFSLKLYSIVGAEFFVQPLQAGT